MNVLFQRIMSCWEEHIISRLVLYYAQKATLWRTRPGTSLTCWMPRRANPSIGSLCSHPSPPMMECLYLLSSSIHNLGMSHQQSYLTTIPQRVIANFSAAFVRNIGDGDLQILYDLAFLRHLTSKWKNAEMTALEQAIDRLRPHVCHILLCVEWSANLLALL